MRLPTKTSASFPYGATSAPYSADNPHAGTDYGYSLLNPYVYAPEDISVTQLGNMGDCGNGINATGQNGRTYRFCHLRGFQVEVGDYKQGTVLGKMGDTGLAFGKHLHFVMWVNGVRVDGDKTIKKLMEAEMLTQKGLNTLVRLLLGRKPGANQQKWVGTMTFDEAHDKIKAGHNYKVEVASVKSAKALLNKHLPTIMH